MEIKKEYRRWMDQKLEDEALAKELREIEGQEDRKSTRLNSSHIH